MHNLTSFNYWSSNYWLVSNSKTISNSIVTFFESRCIFKKAVNVNSEPVKRNLVLNSIVGYLRTWVLVTGLVVTNVALNVLIHCTFRKSEMDQLVLQDLMVKGAPRVSLESEALWAILGLKVPWVDSVMLGSKVHRADRVKAEMDNKATREYQVQKHGHGP